MKTKIILLLVIFGLSFHCLQAQSTDGFKAKKGMIKVTILYPNGEGKIFDMDYYTKHHMPMIATMFGTLLKSIAIDKGIASGMPNTPLPFLAIGYLYFDKLSDYEERLKPNLEEIRNDFPK
ncbi:EthD family reductase, partial [Chitinophaga sp.]|uniref:EthD family reductase n=1 Tax=Chitinophaga sp. TaxID=1869181 RepID=UPI002F93B675